MPTTTNFGWTTPADTDLVKDGALAIRTLGNGIDTSMAELKGGSTGQNLRKSSNTDMDFVWAGDTANTVIDAEGDLLVGDAADLVQRLAVGTTGQVLTVDTTVDGKIKWATPAGGGGFDLLSTTTLSSSATTISIGSGYKSLQIIGDKIYGSANNTGGGCYARFNSDSGSNYCFNFIRYIGGAGGPTDGVGNNIGLSERLSNTNSLAYWTTFQLNAYAVDGTDTVPFFVTSRAHSGSTATFFVSAGTYDNSAAISSITINSPGGETLYGKVYIYGAK